MDPQTVGLSLRQIIPLPRYLTSRLAAELYDRILDYLHTSQRDLMACSVVCKSWLPACRYHLFADVVYRPGLTNFLKSSEASEASTAAVDYIRKISFMGPLDGVAMPRREQPSNQICLRRLNEILLSKLSWDGFQQILSPVSISATFERVTKLTLRYVRFETPTTFVYALNEFTHLQDLSIEQIAWSTQLYSPPPADTSPVIFSDTLQHISLSFCPTRLILNWLCLGVISGAVVDSSTQVPRDFPSLKSLCLSDVLPSDANAVGLFIASLASSLEHLAIGFSTFGNEHSNDEMIKSIDLRWNTHLKTIGIFGINLFQFPSFQTAPAALTLSTTSNGLCSWVPSLLAANLPQNLQKLVLNVWLSAEQQLDLFDWPRLIEIIEGPSAVPVLEIRAFGFGRNLNDVEKWLRKHLAKLDSSETDLRVVSGLPDGSKRPS